MRLLKSDRQTKKERRERNVVNMQKFQILSVIISLQLLLLLDRTMASPNKVAGPVAGMCHMELPLPSLPYTSPSSYISVTHPSMFKMFTFTLQTCACFCFARVLIKEMLSIYRYLCTLYKCARYLLLLLVEATVLSCFID